MGKKRKVLIMYVICLLMIVASSGVSRVNAKEAEKSIYEIKNNVYKQIESFYLFHPEWKNDTIELERVLFDSKNQISAYMFSILKDGKQEGYLVADCDEQNSVIEYGENLFLNVAQQKVEDLYSVDEKKQKVYYLGGISYVVGGYDDSGKIFMLMCPQITFLRFVTMI